MLYSADKSAVAPADILNLKIGFGPEHLSGMLSDLLRLVENYDFETLVRLLPKEDKLD